MSEHPVPQFSPGPSSRDTEGFVTRTEFYNFVNQMAASLNQQLNSIETSTKESAKYLRDQNGKLGRAVTDIEVLKTKLDAFDDVKTTVEEVKVTVARIDNDGCKVGQRLHAGDTPPPPAGWSQRKTVAVGGISGATLAAAVIKILEWVSTWGQHVAGGAK